MTNNVFLDAGQRPSLEWFQNRRTELIKFYAGDLYAFIDGISQAEWMRKNIVSPLHPSATTGTGTGGGSSMKKKVAAGTTPSAGRTSNSPYVGDWPRASVTTPGGPAFGTGSASTSKKEKVWIGPFPRSSKLKPIRTGLTKHIEKALIEEYAVPARPIIPVASQIDAYDDIRGFMLMLLDERKLLEKLEAQLKSK